MIMTKRQSLLIPAIAALLLSLSGCQLETKIAVDQVNGKTRFTITDGDSGKRCVRSISVRAKDNDKKLWNLLQDYQPSEEKAPCVGTFVFAKNTAGYMQEYSGEELASGNEYIVSVTGTGFQAMEVFTANK